ncbi:MAG: urease accessory protein UreF [Gammaproteobacteria bacterium]|nr:MAG: urease accessory protein UreF [Gammaproteobacteria bacterium]
MAITTTETGLLRLLQLSSAALPVGGYSFSQGLEYAIDEAWLANEADLEQWLALQLSESLTQVDLPLLRRQLQALAAQNVKDFIRWNDYALACRETAELRLTDTAMGSALIKLLTDLNMPVTYANALDQASFVSSFALAANFWQIDTTSACHGYCWSWLENQVAAATKLVPLGQTSAQRLLGRLQALIPEAVERCASVEDQDIGASLPALAMASAWHESQYSRLFRS